MKRLTAILAVAVLCFTLTVPVFAFDGESVSFEESIPFVASGFYSYIAAHDSVELVKGTNENPDVNFSRGVDLFSRGLFDYYTFVYGGDYELADEALFDDISKCYDGISTDFSELLILGEFTSNFYADVLEVMCSNSKEVEVSGEEYLIYTLDDSSGYGLVFDVNFEPKRPPLGSGTAIDTNLDLSLSYMPIFDILFSDYLYHSFTFAEYDFETSGMLTDAISPSVLSGVFGEVLGLTVWVIPVVVGLFGIRKGVAFLIARIRGV